MILKKPYAFFIKNFKLFHFIIFAFASILLYRTAIIYNFMKEYNISNPNVIGKDLTSSLFSPWLYILIILIIIVNIVIIYILIRKEKPFMYYIINITLYITVLVVYIVSHSVIHNMQEILIAARTTLAIRDITNLARMLQTISVIFYLVRATGFDIKKFDFVRDLQGLDISEEDSEEIEVALEFEKNVAIRNIKKNIRNIRYYYKENKFIVNIIILILIGITCLGIYLRINKYNKIYKENEFFNVSTFTIGVKESNIVTKNYKNEKIVSDDYALVAVKISARSTIDTPLQTGRAQLIINKLKYNYIDSYKTSLIDLGNVYNNENITADLADYILVYQIPKTEIDSKMIFTYVDNIKQQRGKTKINAFNVKLEPNKLDEQNQQEHKNELNNEFTLKNYKINLISYEAQDKFINTYNKCITNTECYDLKEIIVPSIREQAKAILKIEGTFEYDENIGNISTLYSFIEKYGSIKYTYNGQEYIETNDFKELEPNKTKQNNTLYIEVNKEIVNSEKIELIFTIRNNIYKYILRGDTNE